MFGLMPRTRDRDRPGALVPMEAEPFRLMRRELDELFDRLVGRWPLTLPELADYSPLWGTEVEDREKEVFVRVEAPGFEAKDFEISCTDDVLVIRAEHKEEVIEKARKPEEDKKEEGKVEVPTRLLRMERSLTLPSGIDPAGIEVLYRAGVLEIHLPRVPEAVPRRIEVKT